MIAVFFADKESTEINNQLLTVEGVLKINMPDIEKELINKNPKTNFIGLVKNNWQLIKDIQKSTIRLKHKWQIKKIIEAIRLADYLHLKMSGITCIYSFNYYKKWNLALAIYKYKYNSKIRFVTESCIDIKYDNSFYWNWINLRIDTFVFHSKYAQTQFINRYPSAAGKEKLIPLGVALKKLAPVPGNSIFRIVSCAPLAEEMELDKIAEILAYLNKKIIWIHFGQGDCRQKLITSLQELGSKISFEHKNTSSLQEFENYLRKNEIDLFINTSQTQSLYATMILSASYGIPLAGFNTSEVPEIITKNSGILFDRNASIKDNAEKLNSFLISGLSKERIYRETLRLEIAKNHNPEFLANFNSWLINN